MADEPNFRQEDINIDVGASLASLHTKVDRLLKIEERVTSLEAWRIFLTGGWAATIAIGALLRHYGV